ncbi:TonB family protein [Campylobacter sp. CX2-4080-23]|uniref:energy transducer TonB n=1 Tax=Campylobacter porcelli TaxID=1660073 RepID=UPI002EA2C533|nr:TonB family protein [Campylobacter sp. CX2-4080-23]
MTSILQSSKTQSFCLTTMLFIPFIWFGLNFIKPITPSINIDKSISLNQIIQIAAKPAPIPQPLDKLEPITPPAEPIIKKPRHKPKPKDKIKPIPKLEPTKISKPLDKPTEVAATSKPEKMQSFNISNATKDPILAAIKSAIDKEHRYPRMAKKLRQQGEVLVAFIWTKDMELKGVKIINPSPHKILNEAALATIMAASKNFPKNDKTIEIQIPLVYKIS